MGRAPGFRLTASAALLLCLAADGRAQYFGRNKVQYDREDVRILATEHFDIYYSSQDAAAAQIAGRLSERWYARLTKAFDHVLSGRQPVVVYGSHRRFEQTNVSNGFIDESTGGFTESRRRRIVLPFAASLAETDHVLGHEIVHAFQFDMSDRYHSPLGVPLWFVEGMAEFLTLGPGDRQTGMWMRDAVAADELPTIRQLASSRYFPYRWGAALWEYLADEFGEDVPARALRTKRDAGRRLREITGRSLDELTEGWHAWLRAAYAPSHVARPEAAPLISGRRGGGRLNIAASLSPDGRRIVFLSERDQFSIDLFLADAQTGRILRKLLTTGTSATVESLQYLHSAGAWAPDGTRFALATIRSGRPALLLLRVDEPGAQREFPLPQLDEVYSPTWSPDGAVIAFSAMKGGVSDLFTVAVDTGVQRQLTSDAFADLQPSWSPDGRTIAFTTDRFTTNLSRLTFGAYRIGLLDVASAGITALPGIEGASQLDPAWDPAGRSLYFIADPGGVSDIYRFSREERRLYRVTEIDTGVSGVTRVSPALTVAARSGTLAFSVFRNGGFEVHRLVSPEQLAGREAPSLMSVEPLAASAGGDEDIAPVPPLPALASARGTQRAYRPKLALEGIGSPFFSAGGGPIGGRFAGGASLLFGDLLGDQQLLTAVYVSSRLDESSFGALYVNRSLRWTWGVTVDQAPDLRLRTNGIRVNPDDDGVATRNRERLLWTNRRVGGFTAYPLNRSQRVEFSAGVRQIAFARERQIETLSLASGMVVRRETSPLPSEPGVGLAEAGVALVGDTAVFGGTGPMLGSRYRLQTTTTVGGLAYTSVLADVRRYLMPFRPYTLALRLVHSGRYGGDAADFRLRDSYVGAPTLVRGYGPGAVVRSECPGGSADCPALNTLIANRLVAAKVELRVPVWSTLQSTSRVRYGPVPMDAFLFADAGAGWGGERRFGSGGVDGRIVRSVGAGVRVNLAGLIFETAAVRPLDLGRAGWGFAFNVGPGF